MDNSNVSTISEQTSSISSESTPKPTRKPAVILFEYIGDRSGSTSSISIAQKIGLQTCINDRRKDAENTNATCLLSITTFDDRSKTWSQQWTEGDEDYANITNIPDKFSSEDLDKMLDPRGSTRLIDTACERAFKFENKLKEIHESLKGTDNDKVVAVFVLSTDGYDNSSEKYSIQDLNKVVRRLRDSGVEMMFLAANQDAIASGTSFGFAPSHAMTFGANPGSAQAAFKGLSSITRDVSNGLKSNGFSNNMRIASAPVANNLNQHASTVQRPFSLKMSTCVPTKSNK
tara:strand:+ start:2860 stop:3723 length:864 start_codon:yes stop_codon:yes gene_type:complete